MKEKKNVRAEFEKFVAELAQTLREQGPQSPSELKKIMNGMIKKKPARRKPINNASRLAQDLIYDAWETRSRSERIRLAKRALLLDSDCADAYNVLADDAAKSIQEAIEYYEKGMAAGRRSLGEKKFKEYTGAFWGFLDTRPYMRAEAGLMMCLWLAGEYDAAIDHAKEMLKLNPNDNQGIRYRLISYLAALERYDELERFMKGRYKNDYAAEWLYTRALLSYVKKGDIATSRRELKNAWDRNKHVPDYLTGKKRIPRTLPDRITWGGEDEAFCYASENIAAWSKTPGALDWLKLHTDDQNTSKRKPGGKKSIC
ncbi:MAG: hypothetical protein EG826_16580 [Deltaproteobacteria bacterium]|nr:hypothetical protein [Deltaproteobacteria bacterium]